MSGNIDPAAKIGTGAKIHPMAVIQAGVTVGDDVVIHPFAVLGGPPQHLKDKGEGTTLEVGPRSIIREHATLNRGTKLGGGRTVIGADCYLMIGTHVGHDCILGNEVVLAGGTVLAGHIEVEDFVLIGGHSAAHQFCRIGTMAMLAAGSGLSQDVPPYCMAVGNHARLMGLNEVGLDRRGVPDESIRALRTAYRRVFRSGLPRAESLAQTRSEQGGVKEVVRFLDFIIASGKRGVARHGRG